MITARFLKNGTYVLLATCICVCAYQISNWKIYPWIQLLTCLFVPLFSLLLTEMIKSPKSEIRMAILATTISQLVLSFIIITSPELVAKYWRLVFFPSFFIILILTYSVSLRKDKKYHTLFKILTAIILIGASIRFMIYNPFIDYTIEILFLFLIILIFRAKNKKSPSNSISES